jgi:hypothetical protein
MYGSIGRPFSACTRAKKAHDATSKQLRQRGAPVWSATGLGTSFERIDAS